jgi:hypothetical protein
VPPNETMEGAGATFSSLFEDMDQVGKDALAELAEQPDVQGKCTRRRWQQLVSLGFRV